MILAPILAAIVHGYLGLALVCFAIIAIGYVVANWFITEAPFRTMVIGVTFLVLLLVLLNFFDVM